MREAKRTWIISHCHRVHILAECNFLEVPVVLKACASLRDGKADGGEHSQPIPK